MAKHLAALVVCIFAVGAVGRVFAQRNDEQVNGFNHTVFSQRDGAFGHISSMAQTPDGWLWIAERDRLYRFDGITPEPVDLTFPDSANLSTIFAAASGDVWLSYSSGRVVVLPNGDFHHPRTVRNKDGTWLLFFAEDKRGGIWSYADTALYKAHGDEWRRVGKEAGLDAKHFYAAHMDTEGTLWVLTDVGVFTLADGQTSFEHNTVHMPWLDQHLGKTPSDPFLNEYGQIYLSIVITLSGKKEIPNYASSRYRVITDTQGGFWVFSPALGIRRADSPTPEALTELAGSLGKETSLDSSVWIKMSSSEGGDALEDRQHNVWVPTRAGLEVFRPNVATRVKLPRGDFAYAMLPDRDGSIWFGTAQSEHAYRWWHVASAITPADGYDRDTTAAYRDTDDSVLLGTGGGLLYRFKDGKFEPLVPLPPDGDQGDDVIAIARDGHRKLWVSIIRHPIARLDGAYWTVKGGFDQLPDKGGRRAIVDAHGRLWLSYPHDVFVIDGAQLTRYGSDTGMDITNVGDIVPDGIALVGGADGLVALDNNRFHRLLTFDPSVLTNINGLVRLKDGSVWLYGQKGAVRINAGEIERALKDPGYKMALRVFDDSNGVPGAAQSSYPTPSLVAGTDGRLWLAGDGGLAWIDPAKIGSERNPTVAIRSIIVGNTTYEPDALPGLTPGTRDIQINYTAIGLSDATRARFRYKLLGVDNDWQDVGSRRQAFYTNMGPGTYQFLVEAANEDNAWVSSDAHIDVTIDPAFYQTMWFRMLSGSLLLAFLWIAYLYHLRRVTRRLRYRLEERYTERDRIARELHDTILQTVHGLALKVSAVGARMPEGSSKDELERTIVLANAALVEGRNRVHALRTGLARDMDLVTAFREVIDEYHGDETPLFNATSSGDMKHADPLVIDELYASGREAIINALNHAVAKEIRVGVHFDRAGIRVEVADDGIGIDPKILQEGGIQGHWGIRGIRERLDLIGGDCQITSSPTKGTTAIFFVPARHAYARR